VEQLDSTSLGRFEVFAGSAEERRTWGKRGERCKMEAAGAVAVAPLSEAEDSTQEVRRKGEEEGWLEEELGVPGTRIASWVSPPKREERYLKPTRAKATATGMETRTRAHMMVDFHWLWLSLPLPFPEPLLELESVQRMNTWPAKEELDPEDELLLTSWRPRAAERDMGTSEKKRAELVPEMWEPKADWMEEEQEEDPSPEERSLTIFSSNHRPVETLWR
jgi:hypothetical protein